MSNHLLTIEVGSHSVGVLAVPPPHLMFLASQMQSAPPADMLTDLARSGGLAAICVRDLDGEPVALAGALPKTLDELAALGRGFIMTMWSTFGGYEEIGALIVSVMGAYKKGDGRAQINPT